MLLAATSMEQTGGSVSPVLSVQNLTTSFRVDGGWKSVVRNMSFEIAPRETVAIVGESGSGKSVTSLSIIDSTFGFNTGRCVCVCGRECACGRACAVLN